jgi:hypothetical protein
MTIVFDRGPSAEPKTHALVIGCGRFPWIDPSLQPDRQSCFDSAAEVIKFLVERADDLIAPLATIDCLMADPAVDPDREPDRLPASVVALGLLTDEVERPLARNVEDVLHALRNRCDPGDSIFIYLTSHGVAGRDERGLLVLEDANRRPADMWGQVLNVKSLAQYLPGSTQASSVWIFMDACQEVLGDIVNQVGGNAGMEPIKVNIVDYANQPVTAVALAAVHLGGEAYAPPAGGVAYFTQALLEGLGSCCVEWREREWRVTGQRVLFGLDRIARALDGREITPQALVGFNMESHLLRVSNPSIPVHIASRPEAMLADATAACLVDGGSNEVFSKNTGQDWRFRVPPRPTEYRIRIQLGGETLEEDLFVEAPAVSHEVSG